RARRAAAAPTTPAEIDHARVALLQLPRVSALRLLGWGAGGYAASAVVLGLASDGPQDVTIALILLWVALLGPIAAIAYGWARALLRPETMAAPASAPAPFIRTHDMRVRLVVSASIASAGAIIAPLAAGYLWLTSAPLNDGHEAARLLVTEAALSAAEGDGARLSALLADNPSLTLIANGQAYGAVRGRVPVGQGLIDEDGDGVADTFVARHGRATALIPLVTAGALPTSALWFAGLSCLGCCVLALALVAEDLNRDVARATEQVYAVAEGRAPPPMSELSLSSLEIRELVRSVDRLVGRITEANVAKYIAIEKAKEADRLKSQFLANMSHDLRSPLNSILGFSELLISGIDGEVADEQREYLEIIHDSGRHLLQEIDDILDTAKIEAGRLDLHCEPTPPATLLTRAIQNVKRHGQSDVEYRTVVAAGLPPVFVDPYRAVQALENVLRFATERMDKEALDEAGIEQATLEIEVRRGVSEDRRMVFFSVTTPVAPATAEQLAQARRGFYRIPGHRGLGLGLPIAGSIVELSGGAMGIEDLGEGMEFTIMLPAPEARRVRSLRLDPKTPTTPPGGTPPTEALPT
ncbi:MAG: HAMP domain-containing histidine kinase, partial [Nannocystaceae bacterium]|nr:HAMP domain-containing histidine kinase [Nannocystaceae bacterium]